MHRDDKPMTDVVLSHCVAKVASIGEAQASDRSGVFTFETNGLIAHTVSKKFHSISRSASPSSCDGIVRPSALAVLRFIVKLNFVGCSIGRVLGFAPLRILST